MLRGLGNLALDYMVIPDNGAEWGSGYNGGY